MKKIAVTAGLMAVVALAALAGAEPEGEFQKEFDDPLDHAIIYQASISKEDPLRIRPFPADNADVGKTGKKKNKQVADQMKEYAPAALMGVCLEELERAGFIDVAELKEGDPVPENAMIVEGEFTVLNPGSQAKRYWAGFGAGKSKVCATGRMVDTSDAVLMEFDHCRIGAIGIVGGDSSNLMSDDSRETGSHLAEFLKKWAEGKYQ
jgi:hypothetical protein